MLVKILILVVMLVIAISLFGALQSLVRNRDGDKKKMVRLLTIRVGFSVALLILLALSMMMGWIQPHGLHPEQQAKPAAQSTP